MATAAATVVDDANSVSSAGRSLSLPSSHGSSSGASPPAGGRRSDAVAGAAALGTPLMFVRVPYVNIFFGTREQPCTPCVMYILQVSRTAGDPEACDSEPLYISKRFSDFVKFDEEMRESVGGSLRERFARFVNSASAHLPTLARIAKIGATNRNLDDILRRRDALDKYLLQVARDSRACPLLAKFVHPPPSVSQVFDGRPITHPFQFLPPPFDVYDPTKKIALFDCNLTPKTSAVEQRPSPQDRPPSAAASSPSIPLKRVNSAPPSFLPSSESPPGRTGGVPALDGMTQQRRPKKDGKPDTQPLPPGYERVLVGFGDVCISPSRRGRLLVAVRAYTGTETSFLLHCDRLRKQLLEFRHHMIVLGPSLPTDTEVEHFFAASRDPSGRNGTLSGGLQSVGSLARLGDGLNALASLSHSSSSSAASSAAGGSNGRYSSMAKLMPPPPDAGALRMMQLRDGGGGDSPSRQASSPSLTELSDSGRSVGLNQLAFGLSSVVPAGVGASFAVKVGKVPTCGNGNSTHLVSARGEDDYAPCAACGCTLEIMCREFRDMPAHYPTTSGYLIAIEPPPDASTTTAPGTPRRSVAASPPPDPKGASQRGGPPNRW